MSGKGCPHQARVAVIAERQSVAVESVGGIRDCVTVLVVRAKCGCITIKTFTTDPAEPPATFTRAVYDALLVLQEEVQHDNEETSNSQAESKPN